MADSIVARLRCVYAADGCGVCTFCVAKAEIERLRTERDMWQATAAGLSQDMSNADDENERLRVEVAAWRDLDKERIRMLRFGADEMRRQEAEIERLRAVEYVVDLGVDWCLLHHGIRNEGDDRCDAFDWADGDDIVDDDGQYLPCDVRPLAYREARRG